ncbi:uncharacterized protein LOC121190938, partial [Tachysurus ichikawai]
MKTLERLILQQLQYLDPLISKPGVKDTIVYLLISKNAHINKPVSTVKAMFFVFSLHFWVMQVDAMLCFGQLITRLEDL